MYTTMRLVALVLILAGIALGYEMASKMPDKLVITIAISCFALAIFLFNEARKIFRQ